MARAAGKATSEDPNPEHDAFPESRALHEAHDKRMLDRTLFFTDAIFAIMMTLLVLELKPPELNDGRFWEHMFALRPQFIAFIMSFALSAIFWAAHLSTTRRLIHFDWPVAWTNIAFLFPVALIPFASAMLGAKFGGEGVWEVYCGVLIAASALMVALVLVASRGGGRLMGGVTGRERTYRCVRAAAPGIGFGAGLGLEAAGLNGWSHFCWVLIPVALVLAGRFWGPRRAAGLV